MGRASGSDEPVIEHVHFTGTGTRFLKHERADQAIVRRSSNADRVSASAQPRPQARARYDPRAMSREIVAGVTTFFTMAYIVVVNPAILSAPGTGIPFSGALTATVLVCFTMTLLMGVYARLPFGVAPGMGLNAFFTYTLIINGGVPWPVALGIIFWAGVLFLLVSATPLRERIAMAIPRRCAPRPRRASACC